MKEKIHFTNTRGDRLCAIWSDPKKEKINPVAVLCHGFSTSKDGRTCIQLEKRLNDKKIATFRFDFFGHGESEGKFEKITVTEAVDDVQRAILFLKESGYSNIGLIGSSFGGLASIIASSQIPDLRVLALKSPVSDYLSKIIMTEEKQKIQTWREKGFIQVTTADGSLRNLSYSFYQDAETVSGYEHASKIKCPTLIVHGDDDETVPVGQSQKLARLIPNSRLEIIPGADHTYSRPEDFQRMVDLLSRLVIKNLKVYE